MVGIELSPEAQAAKNREEARKVFRVQLAMSVLESVGIKDYDESGKEGAASANSCRKRAAEVVLKYLNED